MGPPAPPPSLRQQLGLDRAATSASPSLGSVRGLLEQDDQKRLAAPQVAPPLPGDQLQAALEVDHQRRLQQGEDLAMASFAEAVKHDPDVRAEAQDIARQLGVQPDAVVNNRDVMRQFLKVRDQRVNTLAGLNPVLARQMTNIEFARIAHDDVGNLGSWEQLFAQWDAGKLEYEQGVLGERLRSNQATQADLERLAWVRNRLRAIPQAGGFLQGSARILGQQAIAIPQAVSRGTTVGLGAAGVAAIAGQMGPQALLPEEVLTVPSAFGLGFTSGFVSTLAGQAYQMEAGSAYLDMILDENRDANVQDLLRGNSGYDLRTARIAALGVGIANAGLEMVGEGLLAKGAGITAKSLRAAFRSEVEAGVADALKRETRGAAVKEFLKGYGEGLAGETITETLQEGVNITAEEITRRLSENPDALSSSVTRGEVVKRLVDTAVQTAQGMALLAAPGPVFNFVRDNGRAAAAEHTVGFWRDMATANGESKVVKRNVGAHEQFLAAAAQGTSAENTYIDGQAFAEVLRQANSKAAEEGKGLQMSWGDQLDREIPGLQQRIAEAAARGEDVVIPTSQVGSKLAATEIYRELVPHMRLNQDAMSFAEAQVFRQQAGERAAEAERLMNESDAGDRAFADSARQVEDNLRQQLVAAGRTTAVADTEAKLYRDLVIVQAQRAGQLPGEFHAQYPLRVRAGELQEQGPTLKQEGVDAENQHGDNRKPDELPVPERAPEAPAAGGLPADSGTGAAGAAAGGQPLRRLSRDDVSGIFAARTELARQFGRQIGVERVATPNDAAQAMAYLGAGASERFDALVTDKDGRPLAIVGGFKGGVDQTSVNVPSLVLDAFRVQGAAEIWLAHNHPSGSVKLSREDRVVLGRIAEAFRGSEIRLRGLFAIGGKEEGGRTWSFDDSESGLIHEGTSKAPATQVEVPFAERQFTSEGRMGRPVKTPAALRELIARVRPDTPGLLLFDTQLAPVAFVPVSPGEVELLRTSGRMDALYRAVGTANANAVVIVKQGGLTEEETANLTRFANSLDMRVLDVAEVDEHGVHLISGLHGDAKAFDAAVRSGGRDFASGTSGFYRPSDFTIFLTKKQNGSTFVHELAHHYLTVLADLARQKAHPGIVDDFNALLDWFGVKDVKAWDALGFKGQELHHEAFARSFELWMWEGKAPSRQLEGIFARVALWIRRAYGTITGEINAQYRHDFGRDLPSLTPEVRAVMGRMLASERDVEHASAVQNMADTFTSQVQAGMDDATWAEHQDLEDAANSEAVDGHTRDSLRELQWLSNARSKRLRELQKQHDSVRAAVREEVEAAARREPVNRARAWLERGELVDADTGTSTQQVGGVHKLQTEAVQALLPPGTDTKTLVGRRGILAKDGLLPDVAARLFGFPTGEDLVRALVSAPPIEKAIDERTDARMLSEYGDLADPKRREDAVQRSLHNEARGRLIAVDLHHIAKMLGPVRLLVQAAREQAKRIIANKQVWELSPRDHQLAETRAARAFTEAMKDGDVAAAVEAQKRRLLEHELVKASAAALGEVDEAMDDFSRFGGTDEKLAKTRDIDLVYVGRALAAAFGIGPAMTTTQERQLVATAREKLRKDYAPLASRVDSLLDDQPSGVRGWRELPLDTFRELAEVAQALWSEAGKAKVIEFEGRKRDLAAVVAGGKAQIDALPTRKAPGATARTGKTPSPLARFVLKGWNVVANLKRFEHWAWFMDGGKLGWFAENFVLPLRSVLSGYWTKRAEVAAKMHPRILELRKAAGPLWDAEIAVPEASLGEPLVLRGKKELIGLLLHAGSESNLAKALVPYGFAVNPNLNDGYLDTSRWDRFLDRAFSKGLITQGDVDFVRFVWGLYKELLPADQATHKKLYGFEFHTIELRDFHTPWGTIEGGYVPAFVDQDKVQAPRPSSVLESLAGEEQNFLYSISTGRGHTLQRNPNYFKPLSLDVTHQVQHIDAQLRFTHLQPAIANILRILRDRGFTESLNSYDREAINSVILPMLDNAALQQASRPSGMPLVDLAANWIRGGTSMAMLGFNFLNGVLQLTGFANATGEVRGRYMRSATFSVARGPWEAVRTAMKKSPFMWEKLDQTTRILRDDIARLGRTTSIPALSELARGIKKAKQTLARIAFWPQRFLQGAVDVVTWHAAYQQHIAESKVDGSLTEEQLDAEAIAHADGVVKRTQGSGNPEDLAAYESGTPLMRLFTQFGSYSNVVLNQVMGTQPGWSNKARALGWAVVAPAFLEATLRAFLQGVPDDDKDGEHSLEEIAMLYAKSLTRNVVGLLPSAGPLLLSLAESDGQRVLASPASSVLQQVWQGLVASVEAAKGGDVTGARVRQIGAMLTIATGLPIVPLTRAIGYDVDVARGRAQPTSTADYLRGLVVGR